MNCKEFVLDDMMAITAIPIADVSASDPSSPVNILAPTISSTGFSPALTHAIVIGLKTAGETAGTVIPIKRMTGKAKDDEGDSVAGRLHTVTVTCEVDERGGEIWTHQLTLERTAHHLLLTFRDGATRGFVAASEDSYLCNIERDGGKTTVTFRIHCLMGIQMIILP